MAAEDYLPHGLHSDDIGALAAFYPTPARHRDRQSGEPRNHNKPWTKNLDGQLLQWYHEHTTVTQLAARMERTRGAIEARLMHHGIDYWIRDSTPAEIKPATPQPRKDHSVNVTHLLTLMQKDFTTVQVSIPNEKGRPYTYKAALSMDLKVMDKVVIYGGERLTCGTVTKVDKEPQVDFDAPYDLKWVVQKIDLAPYEEQVVREVAALAALNKRRRENAVEQAMHLLFGERGTEGIEEVRKILNG